MSTDRPIKELPIHGVLRPRLVQSCPRHEYEPLAKRKEVEATYSEGTTSTELLGFGDVQRGKIFALLEEELGLVCRRSTKRLLVPQATSSEAYTAETALDGVSSYAIHTTALVRVVEEVGQDAEFAEDVRIRLGCRPRAGHGERLPMISNVRSSTSVRFASSWCLGKIDQGLPIYDAFGGEAELKTNEMIGFHLDGEPGRNGLVS